MKLTLIVPGLLAVPAAALAASPALCAVARHAGAPVIERNGLLAAIAAAAGTPRDAALAPLLASGAGFGGGSDYVIAADPVTLAAGRADVVLAGRVEDLGPDESAALIDALNRHFADDGLTFVAPRRDAWFAHGDLAPSLVTTPTDAVLGAPIFDHLPQGADGKAWQRWQTEIQMLLFVHPVNDAREQRGLPAVTGVWFWGGGRPSAVPLAAALRVFAADGRAGDLARGLARSAGHLADGVPRTLGEMLAQPDSASSTAFVILPDAAAGFALTLHEDTWIAPAVAALVRGSLSSLEFIADGGGTCARWSVPRPSGLARIVSRFRGPAFAVPPRQD